MNVRRNIGFPLKCQGMPAAEIKQRVEETAKFLRIGHLLDQPVSRLAGGDRQRVALGRAIVRRPMAFLMDEPLGTLDTEFRDLMVRELRELHLRINATTVYVTHDQLEAMAMADKIAVMNRGVIEQFATPQEIYDQPATHVRRRLHRLAADELPALPLWPSRRCGERAGQRRRDRRAEARRGHGGDRARARRPPRAYPLRRRLAASRHGVRRRVSRHHPDRHRHHRARRGEGPPSRRRAGAHGRDRRPLAPAGAAVDLRSRQRARAFARALHEGRHHG